MRFIFALAVLSAAAFASAEAIEGLVERRATPTTSYNSQLCGCLSDKLNLGGVLGSIGHLDICVCEKDIPNFVSGGSNSICNLGVRLVGASKIQNLILALLKAGNKKQQCTFPEHAKSACSSTNICGHQCVDGYETDSKNGNNQCSCPPHKVICNGKCQYTCSSQTPGKKSKRNVAYWGKLVQKTCETGWKSCGKPEGGIKDWECVDVKNDLWSCGDCPADITVNTSGDQDEGGKCVINKCTTGYKVSSTGDNSTLLPFQHHQALSLIRNLSIGKDRISDTNKFLNITFTRPEPESEASLKCQKCGWAKAKEVSEPSGAEVKPSRPSLSPSFHFSLSRSPSPSPSFLLSRSTTRSPTELRTTTLSSSRSPSPSPSFLLSRSPNELRSRSPSTSTHDRTPNDSNKTKSRSLNVFNPFIRAKTKGKEKAGTTKTNPLDPFAPAPASEMNYMYQRAEMWHRPPQFIENLPMKMPSLRPEGMREA
ncbi:hypothetical protein D9757_013514 [Collybiopsis confluens]|uniref:Uncharacterized protein n=1 Tax=Collybiopsis confluens TaxID=2823264 RepID=A0A8H5FQK0_9AGAR|nr:hypothetical protein D9757_013514 [Collybiopsis confluens]